MCIWDPDMSRFCSPHTHSRHFRKGTDIIKWSNATLPDPQHTSPGLSIYRGSVFLMSPPYMPDNDVIFTSPPTYSVNSWFLTCDITFNWSPARAFGIPICHGFVYHPPIAYTLGKGTSIIKSSNSTPPDPQHRVYPTFRGFICPKVL